MKRVFCLILVLALLLCGCGKTEEPVSGQVTPRETETAGVPAEPERMVSLGRVEGGEYRNAYVGYGCKLDSSWTFYSAEELQELPADIAEQMEESQIGDMVEQLTQISDMMAENVDMLTSINVLYTKLGMQERLSYAVLTEKQILEAVLSQQDMLMDAYSQAGIEVSAMELVTLSFLGQERYAIHTTATMQGIPYYTLQVYDYHLGAYGVVTTFASYVEDNTASLPELFYSIG